MVQVFFPINSEFTACKSKYLHLLNLSVIKRVFPQVFNEKYILKFGALPYS